VASLAGKRLGARTLDLRILARCRISAGMASAYNAPVAAALFALEIIFGSFSLDVFAWHRTLSQVQPALEQLPGPRRCVQRGPQLLLGSPRVGHDDSPVRLVEQLRQRRLGRAQPIETGINGSERRLQFMKLLIVHRGLRTTAFSVPR
jgi:hypothetical protein